MQKAFFTVLLALAVFAGTALAQTFTLKQTFHNPTPASADQFGNAVAAVGNKILVGARNDDTGATNAGAVYLFDATSSAPLLTILNPTPAANALFGASVAGFGNDHLVGAPGANGNFGEVYLFNGSTGARIATFANPSATADQFGFAVTAVGNNILIGAPLNDTDATDAGIAYLFDAGGNQLAIIHNPFPLPSAGIPDQFGSAVAAVGSDALIGAPGHDETGFTNAGAAYLFNGNTGAFIRKFTNPNPGPSPVSSDQFGGAVAGVGAKALIGSAFEDTPVSNSGVAYLFDVNITPPIQTFENPTPGSLDQFSFSVAAFGNSVLAVIGAPLDDAGASNAGAAYLYDVNLTSPLDTLQSQPPVGGDQFGTAIAAGGTYIIIAAPFNDTGASDAGTVYLFSSNQPPVANAGADQTIECTSPAGALATLDGSGSSDPDNDQLTYTWRENSNIIAGPTSSPTSLATLSDGSHTITLTVDDGKGATDDDETIINVVDTTKPAISLNGANPMTVECHLESYIEPGAMANDLCDPSPSLVITGSVNAEVLGTYTITYTATDDHNNSASTTRTVHVVDTTPPTITLNGLNPMTLQCHGSYAEPGASASDACDPAPTLVISGSVNTNLVGIYTITYTATDTSNNSASATRTVNVIDTTSPTITLNGANPITIECHTTYSEPGATASDACDTSPTITISGNLDANTVGSYTLTYTATDDGGNSVSTTRTVNVVDTTPPAITLSGANPMTVECHAAYEEPGATASDGCDSSPSITITGSVNANVVGTYMVTYTAADASGNSVPTTRTVNVVDTAPPVVTLNGDDPLTVECHTAYTEPGATASDVCDTSPTLNPTGSVDVNVIGTYTLTYTASDASGNSALKTRTVNVVDTTPPAITVKPAIVFTKPDHKYDAITLAQCVAAVNDACTGSIPISEVFITSVSSDEPDDAAGNGDGKTTEDIVIASDCKSVQVRKESTQHGNGRVYTINLRVSDLNGNVATAASQVEVRERPDEAAIDDGPDHTIYSSCYIPLAKTSAGDGDGNFADTANLDGTALPEGYAIFQNYPNPFWSEATSRFAGNPATEIRFALPEASHVLVKVFNTLGENIRTLADKDFPAGVHVLRWNAQNERDEKVPSGMYFYQLVTPKFSETKKMILAK